jgi:hypothetical protein
MKRYFFWFITIVAAIYFGGVLLYWYVRDINRREQARVKQPEQLPAFKGPYLGPVGFSQSLPATT